MTLQEEAKLSYYRELAPLSDHHAVFLVQHTQSRKIFVKKVLPEARPAVFAWLKRRPVSRIPRIEEVFETDGGLIVIEEYIPGDTLEEILAARGHLSEAEAADLIMQLCLILRELHAAQPPIIHRDIKPSNLIVDREGRLWLIDLDASKHVREGESEDTRLIGTVGYAAPEQYGFGASDVRTDIWSVGVLLNKLLTGDFPKDRPAVGRLGKVAARCLKIDADERYGSVDRLLHDLRKAVPPPVSSLKDENSDISAKIPEKSPQKHPLAPPGFRTGTIWKAVLAVIGYAMIAAFSITTPPTGLDGAPLSGSLLLANRIGLLICGIVIVFFTANWNGIHDKLGITRIARRWLRWALIIAIDAGIFFVCEIILVLLEMIPR